ncbi:hypothetical protein HY732_02255 [Candidatus Uhrbacteria bacterium]|nr:hypothetical protein [Candidatus Uhrbacteria bacterium]
MEKRILFKKGEQRELLDQILDHLSVKDMALACRCSERTIRDWHREKFSIDFDSLRKLCDTTGVTFPEEGVEIKNRYWYTSIGAQLGGIAAMQKYGRVGGDPNHRKKKWREWWEREGKFRKDLITNNPLSIQLPKPSPALAEFVGIVLGDGGITKNQVTITLHRFDDKKYGTFVARLIASLFKVPVGIYQDMNALATSYVISRVILVNFCEKQLGLQRGNKIKHQVDIPEWIKTNKKFSVSCVRGLIDTDGSIFAHRYRVGRKDYSYKKLQFVSRSQPLRQSVFHILQNSGLTARLGRQYDIWIDNQKELTKYFKIIGTHNPKHLNNYLK